KGTILTPGPVGVPKENAIVRIAIIRPAAGCVAYDCAIVQRAESCTATVASAISAQQAVVQYALVGPTSERGRVVAGQRAVVQRAVAPPTAICGRVARQYAFVQGPAKRPTAAKIALGVPVLQREARQRGTVAEVGTPHCDGSPVTINNREV